MYAGKVAEEGPVDRIFRAPRHPYTQKLLGSFPNIRADRRALDTIPGSPPDLLDPPPGCRFHPRCPMAMAVCKEVVPPETVFPDGVRVACHLYPPGTDGARLITTEEVLARGGTSNAARLTRPPTVQPGIVASLSSPSSASTAAASGLDAAAGTDG